MKRFLLPAVITLLLAVLLAVLLERRHAQHLQASKDRAAIIQVAIKSACSQTNALAYEDAPGCEGRYKAGGISVIMNGSDRADVYFGLHDVDILVEKDPDGTWFAVGPQTGT